MLVSTVVVTEKLPAMSGNEIYSLSNGPQLPPSQGHANLPQTATSNATADANSANNPNAADILNKWILDKKSEIIFVRFSKNNLNVNHADNLKFEISASFRELIVVHEGLHSTTSDGNSTGVHDIEMCKNDIQIFVEKSTIQPFLHRCHESLRCSSETTYEFVLLKGSPESQMKGSDDSPESTDEKEGGLPKDGEVGTYRFDWTDRVKMRKQSEVERVDESGRLLAASRKPGVYKAFDGQDFATLDLKVKLLAQAIYPLRKSSIDELDSNFPFVSDAMEKNMLCYFHRLKELETLMDKKENLKIKNQNCEIHLEDLQQLAKCVATFPGYELAVKTLSATGKDEKTSFKPNFLKTVLEPAADAAAAAAARSSTMFRRSSRHHRAASISSSASSVSADVVGNDSADAAEISTSSSVSPFSYHKVSLPTIRLVKGSLLVRPANANSFSSASSSSASAATNSSSHSEVVVILPRKILELLGAHVLISANEKKVLVCDSNNRYLLAGSLELCDDSVHLN